MEMPQNETQQKSEKFITKVSDEAERERGEKVLDEAIEILSPLPIQFLLSSPSMPPPAVNAQATVTTYRRRAAYQQHHVAIIASAINGLTPQIRRASE